MNPLEVHIPLKIKSENVIQSKITQDGLIKLKVREAPTVKLKIEDGFHVTVKVKEEETIKLKVVDGCSGGGGDYPIYTGRTIVTPKVRESTELQTAEKIVLTDIIVREIPYYETGNIKGTTFVIGG